MVVMEQTQCLICSRHQELLTAPRKSKFAHTKQSLTLLERLAHCLGMGEPALLVGETGTGKTSVVQYLADQLDQKLVVQNLSQQTDSSDLLGGFKPVEMRILCIPLKAKFDQLFPKTFSKKVIPPPSRVVLCCVVCRVVFSSCGYISDLCVRTQANAKFIADVDQAFGQQDWKKFILLLTKSLQEVERKFLLLDQKEDAQRKKSSDGTKPTAAKPEKKAAAAAKQASSAEVKGKRKAEAELSKEGASAEAKKPKQAARRKKQAQKPVSPLVRQEWKKLAAAVSKFEVRVVDSSRVEATVCTRPRSTDTHRLLLVW
jgi:flagellar biosynthesis GTPase FlhF